MIDCPDLCGFFKPRSSDVGRSKSPVAVGIGKLAVICQVLRREAIQGLVNQNGQLKFSTLLHSYWSCLNADVDVLTPSIHRVSSPLLHKIVKRKQDVLQRFLQREDSDDGCQLSEMPNNSELQ